MLKENYSQREKELDVLAEQINLGIVRDGIHILDGGKLELIWNGHDSESDDAKRVQVENFARRHDFSVRLGSSLRIAIFQNLN